MSPGPSVSVVIPCFNAATTLERAVRSVDSQHSVHEIIVSDDGSSDESEEITRALGGKIRFVAGPNGGAPSARNRGMRASSCPYVLFLDSDDYVDDAYVDGLAARASSSTDVVLGSYRRISTQGEVFDQVSYTEGLSPSEALAEYLNRPTQTGAFLWRRAFLEEIGGWDEGLAIYQDAELTMRGLLRANQVAIASDDRRFAYWLDNDADHRLSNRFTEKKALSTLGALDRHRRSIVGLKSQRAVKGLAARYYSLARLSFKHDHQLVGARALQGYRALGFSGHEGSLAHRMSSAILGLHRKTLITQALAKVTKITRA